MQREEKSPKGRDRAAEAFDAIERQVDRLNGKLRRGVDRAERDLEGGVTEEEASEFKESAQWFLREARKLETSASEYEADLSLGSDKYMDYRDALNELKRHVSRQIWRPLHELRTLARTRFKDGVEGVGARSRKRLMEAAGALTEAMASADEVRASIAAARDAID